MKRLKKNYEMKIFLVVYLVQITRVNKSAIEMLVN